MSKFSFPFVSWYTTEAWSATVGSSASTAVTWMTEVPAGENPGLLPCDYQPSPHSQMRADGAQAVPGTPSPGSRFLKSLPGTDVLAVAEAQPVKHEG